MFTIAIHFYRLSCECEPRVYESLVDVLSTQCVKSFNRALHSALHGQYGKPKFRAKQACLNLQHKISSHLYMLFTDESRFTLYRADGRRRVYRRRGERFADACVVEWDRFGGGSVMVWGGIAHGIKSQLIIVAGNMTAVRYRDEILRPVAVPLVQQRNLILQQDNARPHVARVCQNSLANNNIAPLAWPPYSPDLTPIEHMWDELDRRVRKRRNPPATSHN